MTLRFVDVYIMVCIRWKPLQCLAEQFDRGSSFHFIQEAKAWIYSWSACINENMLDFTCGFSVVTNISMIALTCLNSFTLWLHEYFQFFCSPFPYSSFIRDAWVCNLSHVKNVSVFEYDQTALPQATGQFFHSITSILVLSLSYDHFVHLLCLTTPQHLQTNFICIVLLSQNAVLAEKGRAFL